MASPFRLALLAGAAALGAITLAAPPAAAQFIAPWGVWAGPPRVVELDDDFIEDRVLPPRVIRRIVAAQGYRLAAAPRLAGDNVIAIGKNAHGERVRFVIDGYSGELLRRTLLSAGPGDFDDRPAARKAKPKRKKSQTAARRPATEVAPKPHAPAPSQAVKTPEPPAPAAAAPKVTDAPRPAEAAKAADAPSSAETPKTSATTATDKTPLTPDAVAGPKPEATPAPQQAAVPTTPAPADKPPLTPDAKPQVEKAQPEKSLPESPTAKPADIGPRVQPVSKTPEAAPAAEARAAAPAPKPAEAGSEKPAQ